MLGARVRRLLSAKLRGLPRRPACTSVASRVRSRSEWSGGRTCPQTSWCSLFSSRSLTGSRDGHTASPGTGWRCRSSRQVADGTTIHDLKSSNGTFVNGVRVTEPTALHSGDTIRVGGTEVACTEAEVCATVVALAPDPALAPSPTTTGRPLGRSTIRRIVEQKVRDELAVGERRMHRTTRIADRSLGRRDPRSGGDRSPLRHRYVRRRSGRPVGSRLSSEPRC